MAKYENYAFIDAQNLNMGINRLGWKLDLVKFHKYLQEKYRVSTVFMFIGFIQENQSLYQFLQKSGYILIFRQTVLGEKGRVKGNVDVDLTVKVLTEMDNYKEAVIVSSDGDFYPLVEYLYRKSRLKAVISPYRKTCSNLLKKSAKEKIAFLDRLTSKLELTKKEASD